LSNWTSPYALASKDLLQSKLPAALVEISSSVALDGLASSTRTSYAAGLLRFNQFCDNWHISEADRMPASAALLAAFASSFVGLYSSKTINLWLSGLRSWHIINHAPWLGDNEHMHLIRKAADRRGSSFKRPPCPPVSLDLLRRLLQDLDLNDPFHATLWATATTSFFACRRLGETTVPSLHRFDPLLHCTRSVVSSLSALPNGAFSLSFRIPWTKTTRADGFLVVLTSREDSLCPVAAFVNHLRVNSSPPSGTSLFAYKSSSGPWTHMFKGAFMNFVSSAWGGLRGPQLSGHSFRIGGAVALLLAGVSPEIVAATGGWTSMAFLLYWRRVEDIIPLNTSLAYSREQISRVSSIMHTFGTSYTSST
jgi:hypothetical protein